MFSNDLPKARSFLFLAFLILFLPFSSFCQKQHYFENPIIFNANNGIEVGSISDVVIDKNGFLWIAGDKGLQRFDGYHFKRYQHDLTDSLSLINNNIRDLFYDEEKNQIWIATWGSGGGLSILDLNTEKFKNYHFDPNNAKGITGNTLYWTFKDKFGNYWTSIKGKGLAKYLPESDSFETYSYQALSSESDLNTDLVNRFEGYSQDVFNDSLIWLGTGIGLLKFNVVTGKFIRYPFSNLKISHEIKCVFHHQNNLVYVGTWAEGLYSFDPSSGQFTKCNISKESGKRGIPGKKIFHIDSKSKSQLWVTTRAGLLEYDVFQNKVVESKLNDLAENKLYGIFYKDKKERILVWQDNRLFVYDPMRQQLKPYRYERKDESFYFIVRRILEDDKTGKLWVAAQFSEGLYQIDLSTGAWEIIPPPKGFFEKRTHFNCWDILKTRDGKILVLEEKMIYQFSKKEKKLIPWEFQTNIKNGKYHKIIEDTNGNIWVTDYYEGVFKINPVEKTIRQFKKELTGPDKPAPGAVWDLQEDRKGNIWIRCRGYSVYDPHRDTVFNFPYFFPDKKIVYHIESLGIDGEGNVLVTSHEKSIGITNADAPEKGVVEYFDKSRGLKIQKPLRLLLDKEKNVWILSKAMEKINADRSSSQYFSSAYIYGKDHAAISQLSDGIIAIGFRKAVGIFNPDSLSAYQELVHPYVRSFKVFDKELKTELSLFQTTDVYLKPHQNFFSLEISALNPAFFGKIGFLYQLEGVDPDWVNPGNRSYIAYTDVGSGAYTFKLKAKNSEGIWNETPYKLRIHIAAPWYRTWWAYALAVFLVFGIVYFIYRFQLTRKSERQEAQRLKELDIFKTRFYSNITHEFRTPLTVIQGMASELENHPENEPKKKLSLIKKNSRNLLSLVNQMLDLSKLKAGKLTSDLQQGDVIIFIKYLVEAHESFAKLQNIGLQFYSEEQQLLMDFEQKKLERVLANLISNAIKFTAEYGKILVVVKKIEISKNTHLQILVKDNGIGISKEQLPYIFDRFHQANPLHDNQGTGIGLALVKELMEIMNGTIKVESELEKGTTFFLTFPIQNKAALISKKEQHKFDISSVPDESKQLESEDSLIENGLPILLIIEDNIDVTYYLKACLEDQYQILSCRNGKDGIEKALEVLPDIIISDVMMPLKDGFEVVATLKKDERSSHIPIILLTAKATSEDKLAGLAHGADAYLIKPFEKAELMIRLNKLMEIRQILQKKFSAALINNEANIPKNAAESFIEKIEKAILDHLEDEDFSVNELARVLILSRSQVHRKIKALTGMSTAIFIRTVRLQKAKELLASETFTISEIAYKVGFKSPVYFSQAFKDTFGESPSATRK